VGLCVLSVLVVVCGCALGPDAAGLRGNFKSEEAVADVAAGRVDVANAAWWGFNENDSTAALQGAINSGAKKVIVPYMGKDWIIRPIHLVSNQEIIFEPGVVVVAKKGEFKGVHDSLFRAAEKTNITLRGYGATLRMHKEDYRDAKHYTKAEWRMGIMCLSSSNIKIMGFTIADTGGDGIYLGNTAAEFIGKPAYNKNIVIKDCLFDNNYRQGISIIGAVNLLIENCVFKNTSGTAPSDGIDFEPNGEENKLTNCVVRNCVFENNDGCGVQICITALTQKTENISILIENCHIKSSKSYGFLVGTVRDDMVKGLIEYRNCTVENTGDAGFIIYDKPDGSVRIRFVNCKWKNVLLEKKPLDLHVPMLSISGEIKKPATQGATDFVNCYLYGPEDKQFFVPVELEKSYGIHRVKND